MLSQLVERRKASRWSLVSCFTCFTTSRNTSVSSLDNLNLVTAWSLRSAPNFKWVSLKKRSVEVLTGYLLGEVPRECKRLALWFVAGVFLALAVLVVWGVEGSPTG